MLETPAPWLARAGVLGRLLQTVSGRVWSSLTEAPVPVEPSGCLSTAHSMSCGQPYCRSAVLARRAISTTSPWSRQGTC